MPSNVRQLLDNGVPVYPITDKSLVIGLQDVPFESYVVAWDGASTPVPSNIPAGVVVTYNTTDYTGTLAAGSATAPYLYLVASASQQGEYDRYIVTHTGSTYAWTQLGSTAPVSPVIADNLTTNDASKALSAKQGKILGEEVGELEAKVTDLYGGTIGTVGYFIDTTNANLFSVDNTRILAASGNAQGSQSSYSASDFVFLAKGDTIDYYFELANANISCIARYDLNKTFVGNIATGAASPGIVNGSYTMPSDGYVRFCQIKANKNLTDIRFNHRANSIPAGLSALESYDLPKWMTLFASWKLCNAKQIMAKIDSTGAFVHESGMVTTAFIPVTPGKRYCCVTYLANTSYLPLALYSSASESSFISGAVQYTTVAGRNEIDFICPSGANYAAVSYKESEGVGALFEKQTESLEGKDIPSITPDLSRYINESVIPHSLGVEWEEGVILANGNDSADMNGIRTKGFLSIDESKDTIVISASTGANYKYPLSNAIAVLYDNAKAGIIRLVEPSGILTISRASYPNAKYVRFACNTTAGATPIADDAVVGWGVRVSGVLSEAQASLINQVKRNTLAISGHSGKYMHISIDDVIVWADLIVNENSYDSIFDNSFLNDLKVMHESTSATFTLNCFCSDGTHSIADVPTKFVSEFEENKGWLRFAFHAEDTDTHYDDDAVAAITSSYNTFVTAIMKLTGTIDCIDRVTRLGFFSGSLNNVLAVRNCPCGIVGLTTADDNRVSYYLDSATSQFLQTHGKFWDNANQICFIPTQPRLELLSSIDTLTDAVTTGARRNQAQYLEVFTHQQSWGSAETKMSQLLTWAVGNGYTFGFWHDIFKL